MSIAREQIQQIRSRLRSGELTEADVEFLGELLDGAEQIAGLQTGVKAGQATTTDPSPVDQLPAGLDVVK